MTILDGIQNISIIIASFTAIYGINSWRREATWKRKYELSEEVLSLFYECQEKFLIIRNPAGHSAEGKSRKRNENETPEETAVLDLAYTFIERYENEKAPFNKLASLKFRFAAVFGKEASQPFEDLLRIKNKIIMAAVRLGEYWKHQGRKAYTDEQFQKHLSEMQKFEETVWGRFDENDLINKEIEQCILDIERYCISVTKKKHF